MACYQFVALSFNRQDVPIEEGRCRTNCFNNLAIRIQFATKLRTTLRQSRLLAVLKLLVCSKPVNNEPLQFDLSLSFFKSLFCRVVFCSLMERMTGRQSDQKSDDFLPLILDKIAIGWSPIVGCPTMVLIYP